MVCQAEEQVRLQVEEDPPRPPPAPPLPVEVEEEIGTVYVHNHINFSDVAGPVSMFVKSSCTVDDLYRQIANKLEVPESDFDVNYRLDILPREAPSKKLAEVGITFEDGKRVSLTLTAKVVKSRKLAVRPFTTLFHEEEADGEIADNKREKEREAADGVVSSTTDEVSSLPALTAIEVCDKKYVGLVNQAMTCYLNSLLQSLYMTPEFRNALYKWEFDGNDEESRRKSIPFQLQRLFLKLQTSSKAAVETTDLTRSFGWDSSDSWTQHDVQELCRVMFAALEHKFRNTEQADLINRLYQGKMIDYVTCMECGKERQREDTYLDIPLPIRPFGNETAYGTVEDALKGFVEPETLDGNNQYACENCNKKCDAKKGLKFVEIPYLLTLHLMRFSFDYNSMHRLKLNDKVVFQEFLDMNPFICTAGSEALKEKKVGEPEQEVKEENASEDVKKPEKSEQPNGDESVSSNDESLPPLEIVDEVQPATEPDSTETLVVNGKAKINGEDIEDDVFENGEAACISDNNEKNTQRSLEKGPYMYELFAIMIHSGNASGGHYYAYIKDFGSGQWFCFNDQNVTRITNDDIRKTYGGSRSNYYSGYSPSTSAYMLMYRQIDKERNAKFIEVDDFPEHIKAQLAAMQNGNGSESFSRDYLMDTVKVKVFCYLPNSDRQVNCKLNCLSSLTLPEVIQLAQKELNLQTYPVENCRLVCYDNSNFSITKCLHGMEEETIGEISPKLHDKLNFLLQIKTTSEPWRQFKTGDAIGRVYTVDLESEEIRGPQLVQMNSTSSVGEFKLLLENALPDVFSSVSVENITVVMEKLSLDSLYPLEDSSQLFDSDSYASTLKKIFVSANNEGEKSFQNTKLFRLIDRYLNIINLDVSLPDIESEDLEDLEIPLLSAVKQQKTEEEEEEQVADRSSPSPVRPQSSLQLAASSALSSDPPSNEEDMAASTDQSASEDSSLTDSDRTLVGDQENLLVQLSSPSDESAAGDANVVSSPDDPPQDKGLKLESDWDEVDGGRVPHSRLQSNSYFKASLHEEGTNKYLKVEVDKRGTMSWFKKQLESYVGVPCEYFKVVRSNDEYDYQTLTPTFRDGDKVNVRLGRALKKGEYTGKIFKLTPDDTEPLKFLFNCTLSNGMLVSDAKKQILKDLKRKNNIEIPFERCRLRKKSWKNPGQVYYDHQKFEESMCFTSNWEMFLQEIPENWPQKCDDDSLPELVLFVRRWSPSTLTMGPFEEVELNTTSGQELKEKLSELSGVPVENIGIVKAPGSFPCDISVLNVQSELEWVTVANNLNEWPFNIFEDGHVVFYRDNSEQAKELTTEERKKIERSERLTRPRGVGSWTSATATPRKERGLRIYLDPTPPKSSAPLAAAAASEE